MSDATCILDPQRDCIGLNEARRLEAELNDLRRQNSNTHERLWDELHSLKEASLVRDEQYKHILEKLDDLQSFNRTMSAKMEAVEAKPGKRYEDIIKQVISIIVGAIVGLVIAKLGLGA